MFSIQLNIFKFKTYNKAISETHTSQWSQVMREKMKQLEKIYI